MPRCTSGPSLPALLYFLLLQTAICSTSPDVLGAISFLFKTNSPVSLTKDANPPAQDEVKMAIRQVGSANATISVDQPSSCPSINATTSTTPTSGPNGSIFFLNCGISAADQDDDAGWAPPSIRIDQLIVTANFSSVQAVNASVFQPCVPFFDMFVNASAAIGVPPVFLAAFAMQESSCNPRALGSEGSAGLLQLSPEKCINADCYDPATNINLGAQYLKSLLDADSSMALAVGSWNGWYQGMTYEDATSARWNNCYSQQNLDYLQQYFNGWLQNIDGYGQPGANPPLGFYFNLDVCAPLPLPTWSVSAASTMLIRIYWSILPLILLFLLLQPCR